MAASARARFVYPDAFCQPILPLSAMSWQKAVALGGGRLGRRAGHGGRTWWDDDGRLGMALADAGGDAVLIIRPVTRERGDLAVHLVQQGADLGTVIHVVGRQLRRNDPARVSIDADV